MLACRHGDVSGPGLKQGLHNAAKATLWITVKD